MGRSFRTQNSIGASSSNSRLVHCITVQHHTGSMQPQRGVHNAGILPLQRRVLLSPGSATNLV